MIQRLKWIEKDSPKSIREQCALLGIPRSSFYYQPVPETALNLELMTLIDKQYLETPFYGRNKYMEHLKKQGYQVNHKRVERLLKGMGITATVPGPLTTIANKAHQKYPYLLKGVSIEHCNQVWAADITWIPTADGYLYLVAVIDWYSRYILSWALSDSLTSDFCINALEDAFGHGTPKIFNTDQGVQFTSGDFTELLNCREILISMDGRGRYADNIIVERFWRSVKYEEVYLNRYETGEEAHNGLSEYIKFYNEKRMHQSLSYRTPAEIYFSEAA